MSWTQLSGLAPEETPAVRNFWLRRLYLLICFVCLSASLGLMVSLWGNWTSPRVAPLTSEQRIVSVEDLTESLEAALERELRHDLGLRSDD